MKRWVKYGRREAEFQVGDLILLKLGREQFKSPSGMPSALLWWFEGPYKVLEKFGNITYILDFLDHKKARRLVFHIS
jgi:hypothetical protein